LKFTFRNWNWEYLPFRLCIGLWVGIFLVILIALEASAYVCYITRFTEEIFALLIAMIFIVKAFQNVFNIGYLFPVHQSLCTCEERRPNNSITKSNDTYIASNLTHDPTDHVDFYPCSVMPNHDFQIGFQDEKIFCFFY